jgi:NAD-dependent dihydropyrimidine dehydrogenase PreA subunit
MRPFCSPLVGDLASLKARDIEAAGAEEQKGAFWFGIPRAEIQWQPAVSLDRCSGCGLCALACGRGVYAFNYQSNRPVVSFPQLCEVGCTTCATICTQDAIKLPSQEHIRRIIKKNRIEIISKHMLNKQREKYDIALGSAVATREGT